MRRVVAMFVLTVATSAVSTSGSLADACSCAVVSLEEAYVSADAAFIGQLVEVRRPAVMVSSMEESRFVFAVSDVYKGDVHATQSIVTATTCGPEVPVGTVAIVFGRHEGFRVTPDDGEYAGDLCNGTRGSAGEIVPSSFGARSAPLAGSSPIGTEGGAASTVARNLHWIALATLAAAALGVFAIRHRRVGASASDIATQ